MASSHHLHHLQVAKISGAGFQTKDIFGQNNYILYLISYFEWILINN